MDHGALVVDLARSFGGAETRVVDTARGLHELGMAVKVVCLKGSPLAVRVREAGVPVLTLERHKFDPRTIRSLAAVLRTHAGWVVDAHNAQSQLAVQLADHLIRPSIPKGGSRTRPFIATVHSEYAQSERRVAGLSLHRAILSRSIRRGWAMVAVSTSVARDLQSMGADSARVRVIWSGVEGRKVPVSDEERTFVRKEIGLTAEEFAVFCVGRLVPVKHFELAIEAITQLHNCLPTARLVLVGDGPERPGLEELAGRQPIPEGTIRFLGHRRDVDRLIAAADAMAITSTTEGMPYVLLEAAVAQTPVVSTRVGAIEERFSGDAVLLLPLGAEHSPAGADALCEALLALATDPCLRHRLTRQASRVQHEHLSHEGMVTATVEVYRQTAQHQKTLTGPVR